MGKNHCTKITLSVLLSSTILGLGLFSFSKEGVVRAADAYTPSKTYTNHDSATYYSGISATEGTALLSQLRSLNSSKRKTTIGYKNMGTSASGPFSYTDYDPATVKTDSKGQPYGTKVLSFYSGTSTTSFNKEHVWPDSHGGNLVEADIHMPRPTISSENSVRGNSFYVEGMATQYDGWDPITEFGESGSYQNIRGECARIVFYCVVANSSLNLIDAKKHQTSKDNNDNLMGKLSDMLKWNLNYPVNQREKNRNEGAEYLQGNRNPFIDHPEYACMVWGNTNSDTKAICSGQPIPPTPTPGKKVESITLNYGSYRLNPPDQQYQYYFVDLIPTINPSDAENKNVTWSSSNPAVATVTSNGQVRSVSIGNATITCTAADGSGVTATCSIVVGKGGNGCGGSIIVASSLLFIVASVGTGLVLIKKKKDENDKD